MKMQQNPNEAKRNASDKLTIKENSAKNKPSTACIHLYEKSSEILQGHGVLLRLPKVLERYPVARSTWYAGMRAGIYPKPFLISRRAVAWTQESIDALITRQGPESES